MVERLTPNIVYRVRTKLPVNAGCGPSSNESAAKHTQRLNPRHHQPNHHDNRADEQEQHFASPTSYFCSAGNLTTASTPQTTQVSQPCREVRKWYDLPLSR